MGGNGPLVAVAGASQTPEEIMARARADADFGRHMAVAAEQQPSTAPPDHQEAKPPPSLATFIERISPEVKGDKELIKQCVADWNTLQRQHVAQLFDARMEYGKQALEFERQSESSVKEYGMQTLKWAFLINAGTAALILGYIGARAGRTDTSVQTFAPLIQALWPFAVGCVLVVAAGASAYFNYCYSALALPSMYDLHNFLNVADVSKKWPRPRGALPDEPLTAFFERIHRLQSLTRSLAIAFAVGSFGFFGYGVWSALAAVSSSTPTAVSSPTPTAATWMGFE